jgi:probable rRNA maturation factor
MAYYKVPMSTFVIASSVKTYPVFPYETMKNDILGKKYELALQFVGPTRAAKLNATYRQKTYTPNVLSFPLDTGVGEIFICPSIAKSEAKKFNLSVSGYVAYLFIHGLLHLKGHDHSDAMDKLEKRYLHKYSIA